MPNKQTNSTPLASPAEDLFVELFCEVFGAEKSQYLFIQYPVVDIYGNHRYIDFALASPDMKIAIEIDGERYHNPNHISADKYYDDLLKQNSLIYQDWKVYRWVYNQLKNQQEKVKDELVTFLGETPMLQLLDNYLPKQRGKIIELREHQQEAIGNLEQMRKQGESIALLYHATGTGKTVTAVSDAKGMGRKTLFLAHTKELIYQAKNTFDTMWPEARTGYYVAEEKDSNAYVVCGSIQSVAQNLEEFNPDQFDYLIIDECHHSTANTYKKVLGYFKPRFTLGLTATPDRMDGEDLLEVFKNVAHKLDLRTAVELGELVPIRCVRVKTNVDLSSVRINGIKYYTQDLESKLFVPERDRHILETYQTYVKDKKTVVFCASVKHAESVASLFRDSGIQASAVSGTIPDKQRKKTLDQYEHGDLNVLCACDLLNEGWDSPRTQVLFMARPTMSKTLYMQQLGRGMRWSPGKEYLMVFDFIDNANLFNMPYSMHRLFNIKDYRPGEYVVASARDWDQERQIIAQGEKPTVYLDFPLEITDYQLVDLFNWQDEVKDMISQLEFVRMVDVQSETIDRYVREGKIVTDLEIPMGTRSFKYFREETVKKYAAQFQWELITPANMLEKFMDMVKRMDMSYSYKPVLLKAMFTYMNEEGKVKIEDIVDYFIDFFQDRANKGLMVEKPRSIFCKEGYTRKEAEKNILSNPFKRFEDMRFMKRTKDLELVELNRHIFRKLTSTHIKWIIDHCDQKLDEYFTRLNKK